VKAFAVAFYW